MSTRIVSRFILPRLTLGLLVELDGLRLQLRLQPLGGVNVSLHRCSLVVGDLDDRRRLQ